MPNQACNKKKEVVASHDAGNTSTNESREACRNTPARPFVCGSHLRESLGLRQERQMSFLRDDCKHLVVVSGLSVSPNGFQLRPWDTCALWECRDLLGTRETRDIIEENVTLPCLWGSSTSLCGALDPSWGTFADLYQVCCGGDEEMEITWLTKTEVFASQTTASVLSVSRYQTFSFITVYRWFPSKHIQGSANTDISKHV